MKEVSIRASREYQVYVDSGMMDLKYVMDNYEIGNIYVITDENVYNIYYSEIVSGIKDRVIGCNVIKPGENSKNPDNIFNIYSDLIKCGADRKTTILSLGGGVVGDISGFAASTYMRGIGLIHMPTTLMAQCDSSIGGKNGFNFGDIKNIIGSIYQPLFVYNNVDFLKTLEMNEFKSGLAEVVKYGFICNEGLFRYLLDNRNAIIKRNTEKLIYIVYKCAAIKGGIVEKDEYDSGLRQVLNFGHTVGHALESISGFNISHGQAVAAGMEIETYIAVKSGLLDEKYFITLFDLLRNLGISTIKTEIDVEKLMHFMLKDKKKASGNIKFALPVGIGNAIITSEIKTVEIKNIINEFNWRKLW